MNVTILCDIPNNAIDVTSLFSDAFSGQSQILCGAYLRMGDHSLYKWSRSHGQNGGHAHIW